jgi:hypothetical protein
MRGIFIVISVLLTSPLMAEEMLYADLPGKVQVESVLNQHIDVKTAETNVMVEQSNQRKWESGNYEFNIRAGSSQRNITATGQTQREWDVAIERPLRLLNKVFIDSDIGSEGVTRAELALGDAHHEAGRLLLHLWFNWQREQSQSALWQQQRDILTQQTSMTEKRMRAGDAPKMELNQAQAAAALANVSLQQANLRAQLAASELKRPFPELALPEQPLIAVPQAIEHDLSYWQNLIFDDNHELGMVQAETRIQELHARRNSSDRMPDPTIGLRYSHEKEGEEKVAGIYLSLPLSFGLRGANADIARQHAFIAQQREVAVKRRLEGDVYVAYTQATHSYLIWQQAQEAARSVRENADLVARAYSLGESSLSDVLSARRLALESSLTATLMQLDANEARYRLLLDAHLLWPLETHDGENTK